jgi:hypothetical protein
MNNKANIAKVISHSDFANRDLGEEIREWSAAERILKAVDLLMENSEIAQRKVQHNDPPLNINHIQMAKEYCTVKVGTARQTGHSTAIAQFVLNRTKENWIIITPKLTMIDHVFDIIAYNSVITIESRKSCVIEERTQRAAIKFYDGGTVLGFDDYGIEFGMRGKHADGIIIDCSTFVSDKAMNNIYNIGMACMAQNELKYFICME